MMVYIILLPVFVTYFDFKFSTYPFTYPTETRFDVKRQSSAEEWILKKLDFMRVPGRFRTN